MFRQIKESSLVESIKVSWIVFRCFVINYCSKHFWHVNGSDFGWLFFLGQKILYPYKFILFQIHVQNSKFNWSQLGFVLKNPQSIFYTLFFKKKNSINPCIIDLLLIRHSAGWIRADLVLWWPGITRLKSLVVFLFIYSNKRK